MLFQFTYGSKVFNPSKEFHNTLVLPPSLVLLKLFAFSSRIINWAMEGLEKNLDLLSFRCVNSLWKASKQYNTMPSGLIYLIDFFLVSCHSIQQSMECLIVDVQVFGIVSTSRLLYKPVWKNCFWNVFHNIERNYFANVKTYFQNGSFDKTIYQ